VTNLLVAAGGLVALYPTLDAWPWVAHVVRIGFSGTPTALVLFHASVFAALILVLLVPGLALGASLPLLFDRLRGSLDEAGLRAGRLYAWSAAGNLLGGLAGGYALYAMFHIGRVWLVAVLAVLLAAALAARTLAAPRSRTLAAWVPLAALAVWGLVGSWGYVAERFAVGTFRLRGPIASSYAGPAAFSRDFYATRKVLAYRDAPSGTYAVVENPAPLAALAERFRGLTPALGEQNVELSREGPQPRSIMVNGKADSSTFYDRETLTLAAHLPALLAPRLERAIVIGLGTGVTTGELSLWSELDSLAVAEISPTVIEFLPWFSEANHAVHLDPRLAIVRGDAFRVIGRSDERWDVIVSEPSNPWMSGTDQLFSRDFYRIAREHLTERGIFVQWIQRYATTEAIAALVINTLRSEFPHVRAFRAGESDDLFIATTWPVGEADLARARAALAERTVVRASLALVRVFDLDDLMSRERSGAVESAAEYAELGLETLDRPRLHYLSGRAFFSGDSLDASRAALGF
jgi:spermidine synthase